MMYRHFCLLHLCSQNPCSHTSDAALEVKPSQEDTSLVHCSAHLTIQNIATDELNRMLSGSLMYDHTVIQQRFTSENI